MVDAERVLRLARGGELRPWIGTAVRGRAFGRFPPTERAARCTWCPHMTACAYGRAVALDNVRPGWADAARPDATAPQFPLPVFPPKACRPVRVTFIGDDATRHRAAP